MHEVELTSNNVFWDFDDVGRLAELGWVVIFILERFKTGAAAQTNVQNNVIMQKAQTWGRV